MKKSIHNTFDAVPVVQSAQKISDIVSGKPELTWAALIDTAFDHGEAEEAIDFGSVINCYDFLELQGLNAVAPCLVELLPGSDLCAHVRRLIEHCQGRPMLSFVGTAETLEDISARWRAVHMISIIDHHEMLLRFADTRTLSYLPKVLTSDQWRTVCGAVSYWVYFNRSGRLTICDIPDSNSRPEKISITKAQLEQLLDASHPDALMALIGESMCDIIPTDIQVSEQYEMIKKSCELAKKYEARENADIVALAVAAYLTKGASNFDKKLELLLRNHKWSVGALGDAIVDAEIV